MCSVVSAELLAELHGYAAGDIAAASGIFVCSVIAAATAAFDSPNAVSPRADIINGLERVYGKEKAKFNCFNRVFC